MKHYDINIRGYVKHHGLAFQSMKHADENHICGTAKYISENTLLIEAEGSENHISDFIKWCLSLKSEKGIEEVSYIENNMKAYINFDINL